MSNHNDTEQTWTDTAPNNLVSETEVPSRAAELEGIASTWIDNNSQYFDLLNWDSTDEKTFKDKAFNEAGVYLINAFNHGEDNHTSQLRDLVIERVNDQRFAQLILRNPKDIHRFAYPTLYADYVDDLDTDVATALEQVAEQGLFWSSERVTYRLLEFCYLSRIMGIQYEHDEDAIVKYTLLNHQPNIIVSDYLDAYCLTHDVMFYNYDKMFFNDYSNTDGYEPLETLRNYDISKVLRGLILRYMAEDNLDITLELMLSGILQRQISRDMVRFVLSWALEKARTAGHVPGPSKESLYLLASPRNMGVKEASWEYENQDEHEAVWAKNYHTNLVAGITARVLKRDWEKLENQPPHHRHRSLEEQSFRKDSIRLGQLLRSLAQYDIMKGAQHMKDLAESPVSNEYPHVFQEAVDFLQDQRNQNNEFGYWTTEEILYTNNDNSRELFRNELVEPVNEACQKALNAVETSGHQ